MAKLITKEAAVEKDYIIAIRNYNNYGLTIDFKDGKSTFLKDSTPYTAIVQWWRSSCEVDLVLDEFSKCCCNKCCKCCKPCCNNN